MLGTLWHNETLRALPPCSTAEFRGTPLPRTRVKRLWTPRLHRCFIAACLTGRLVKEQADHINLRLLMEGSMLGLVLGA
jgi:hypothetical protein